MAKKNKKKNKVKSVQTYSRVSVNNYENKSSNSTTYPSYNSRIYDFNTRKDATNYTKPNDFSDTPGKTGYDLIYRIINKDIDETILFSGMLIVLFGLIYFDANSNCLSSFEEIKFTLKKIAIFESIPVILYLIIKFIKYIKR